MSFILDALKKSEAERQRQAGPALLEMRVVRPRRRIPVWVWIGGGALLLVSDQPMIPEGVKTEASDLRVTEGFAESHITIGIEALKLIRRHGKSVKHLRFD